MINKIAVFTPTYRWGGLDVNAASIARQTRKDEIIWILADDLYEQRKDEVQDGAARYGVHVEHFLPRARRPGFYRNLCAGYNEGLDRAIELGCSTFFSLQDFFWIPEDAIDRMVTDMELMYGKGMVTALASLTNDPYPDQIVHPEGKWTLYKEDYTRKPRDIKWWDVRAEQYAAEAVSYVGTTPFEANFCGWPIDGALKDVRYDEAFDEHAAFENQDFARQACLAGVNAFIDTSVHAFGLPHKAYWPADEAEGYPHTRYNMALLDKKWNDRD